MIPYFKNTLGIKTVWSEPDYLIIRVIYGNEPHAQVYKVLKSRRDEYSDCKPMFVSGDFAKCVDYIVQHREV